MEFKSELLWYYPLISLISLSLKTLNIYSSEFYSPYYG